MITITSILFGILIGSAISGLYSHRQSQKKCTKCRISKIAKGN